MIHSLPNSAAISKGRFLQRATVDGIQQVLHATDKTVAGGQVIVGASVQAITAAGKRDIDVAFHEMRELEAGAAIAATDYRLTTDAVGRVIPGGNDAANVTLALNLEGGTAAAAGDKIYVYITYEA